MATGSRKQWWSLMHDWMLIHERVIQAGERPNGRDEAVLNAESPSIESKQ
jgi:hypothetical protein